MATTATNMSTPLTSTMDVILSALEGVQLPGSSLDKLAASIASEFVDVRLGSGDRAILVASCVPKKMVKQLPATVQQLLQPNTGKPGSCEVLELPASIPLKGAQDFLTCLMRDGRTAAMGIKINPRNNDQYAPRNVVQKVLLLAALSNLGINGHAQSLEANLMVSLDTTTMDLNIVQAVRSHLDKASPVSQKLVDVLVAQNRARRLGPANYNSIVAYAAANQPLLDMLKERSKSWIVLPDVPARLSYQANPVLFKESEDKALNGIDFELRKAREHVEGLVWGRVKAEEKRVAVKEEKRRAALLKKALERVEAKGTVTQEEAEVLRAHFGRC